MKAVACAVVYEVFIAPGVYCCRVALVREAELFLKAVLQVLRVHAALCVKVPEEPENTVVTKSLTFKKGVKARALRLPK